MTEHDEGNIMPEDKHSGKNQSDDGSFSHNLDEHSPSGLSNPYTKPSDVEENEMEIPEYSGTGFGDNDSADADSTDDSQLISSDESSSSDSALGKDGEDSKAQDSVEDFESHNEATTPNDDNSLSEEESEGVFSPVEEDDGNKSEDFEDLDQYGLDDEDFSDLPSIDESPDNFNPQGGFTPSTSSTDPFPAVGAPVGGQLGDDRDVAEWENSDEFADDRFSDNVASDGRSDNNVFDHDTPDYDDSYSDMPSVYSMDSDHKDSGWGWKKWTAALSLALLPVAAAGAFAAYKFDIFGDSTTSAQGGGTTASSTFDPSSTSGNTPGMPGGNPNVTAGNTPGGANPTAPGLDTNSPDGSTTGPQTNNSSREEALASELAKAKREASSLKEENSRMSDKAGSTVTKTVKRTTVKTDVKTNTKTVTRNGNDKTVTKTQTRNVAPRTVTRTQPARTVTQPPRTITQAPRTVTRTQPARTITKTENKTITRHETQTVRVRVR